MARYGPTASKIENRWCVCVDCGCVQFVPKKSDGVFFRMVIFESYHLLIPMLSYWIW